MVLKVHLELLDYLDKPGPKVKMGKIELSED